MANVCQGEFWVETRKRAIRFVMWTLLNVLITIKCSTYLCFCEYQTLFGSAVHRQALLKCITVIWHSFPKNVWAHYTVQNYWHLLIKMIVCYVCFLQSFHSNNRRNLTIGGKKKNSNFFQKHEGQNDWYPFGIFQTNWHFWKTLNRSTAGVLVHLSSAYYQLLQYSNNWWLEYQFVFLIMGTALKLKY